MKVFLALLVCVLAGCAAIEQNEIRQQSLWLEKAGFRAVKSDRPAASPPGQLSMTFQEIRNRDGTATYTFTDAVNGLVYVGGVRELAAYQQISTAAKARRSANLAQITPSRTRTTGPLVW